MKTVPIPGKLGWSRLSLALLLALHGVQAEEFLLQLGDTVEPGMPAPGAGNLDGETFTDTYRFPATAGQIVFFEEISVASELRGWLRWEVVKPDGQKLFSRLFGLSGVGRCVLTETGIHSIRFFTTPNDPARVGDYAFRLGAVPPDQDFELEIGSAVSRDTPTAGAGRLEVAGSEDHYTFAGIAGQNVFFEETSLAPVLVGALRWECVSPGGRQLFTGLFRLRGVGRITLPETGFYRIRMFVADADPEHYGDYAFQLGWVHSDQSFPIKIGDVIADGLAGPGSGRIEAVGTQDFYAFPATAGQSVVFQVIQIDDSIAGALRWELKTPSGNTVFSYLCNPSLTQRYRLAESGTYTLRLFVGDNEPAHVGAYAFRTFTEVQAHPDRFSTPPNTPLAIPTQSFLCNDECDPSDTLDVELVGDRSAQGASLIHNTGEILYLPPSDFSGTDTFEYRVRGFYGGESVAHVTVRVADGADQGIAIVSLLRTGPSSVELCLLGIPAQTYRVEESVDLRDWSTKETIRSDDMGRASYAYNTDSTPSRFYRFSRVIIP